MADNEYPPQNVVVMSVDRIADARLRARVVSAEAAAALIQPGETVAMSGFTGSGYPKAVPVALAQRIEAFHADNLPFQISLMTGASTAPELDGALAKADGIAMRMPFQSCLLYTSDAADE